MAMDKELKGYNDISHNVRMKNIFMRTCCALALMGCCAAVANDGPGTYYVPPAGTANRAANAQARPNALAKRTIAFLGGSITEMNGFRPRVMSQLRAKYPNVDFVEIASGLSSTCSDVAAFRFADDVLAKGMPDLLIVDAAVNDDQDGHFTREHCIRGMEGVLRQARRVNPAMKIVVALFVNHDQFNQLMRGQTPLPYAAHRTVAEHYGVAVADVGTALASAARAGTFTWQKYRDCHPSPEGCDFAAKVVMDAIVTTFDPLAKPAALPLPDALDAGSYAHAAYVPFEKIVRDAGWNVSKPDWKTVPGSKRDYFATGPALWSVTPGATCELSFTGTALAAILTAGPDAGALEVSIDGGAWTRLGLYMPWSAGLNYPYARMLADDLKDAPHTARLRVATDARQDKTFSAVRIHRLVVNMKGAGS